MPTRSDRCRSVLLLSYFGETSEANCGHCDNCEAGAEEPTANAESTYELQSRVSHPEFGEGVVTDVEDDRLTVLFDDVGYRTLSSRLVEEQGLLCPAAEAV